MYQPIVCQVEAIVKQPTGTMLTTNVSTIAGHQMISEQVEVHFYKLHPNILGGGHAVWNDNIDLHETGLTSYDIFKRFFKSMQTTAERTWGLTVQLRPLQNVPYQRALMRHSQILIEGLVKATCLPSILKQSKTMQEESEDKRAGSWLLK